MKNGASRQHPWRCLQPEFLLTVILVQWLLLAHLLSNEYSESHLENEESSSLAAAPRLPPTMRLAATSNRNQTIADPKSCKCTNNQPIPPTTEVARKKWDGVALCLMLRRPQWWFKRYNVMIHNALANIPSTWAVQLMIYDKFWKDELLAFHRGIPRLLAEYPDRIILTTLPPELATKKPKVVLKDRWIWQNAAAETILTFHGEGMLCGNSLLSWKEDWAHVDYVGAPWGKHRRRGGAGSTISLRKRSAMLAALDYEAAFPSARGGIQMEDAFFVATLLYMNEQREGLGYAAEDHKYKGLLSRKYHVATPEETLAFSGTSQLDYQNKTMKPPELFRPWGPMAVIGTLSELSDGARNWVLGTCPEIKVIFPSLHHPTCFGAKPQPEQCAWYTMGVTACNVTSG